MPVYRKIPLTSGTLMLVHSTENPGNAHSSWREPTPASINQESKDAHRHFVSVDSETTVPDPEVASVESAASSAAEQELKTDCTSKDELRQASDSLECGETRSLIVNAEFSPKLSPLPSLWANSTFCVRSSDIDMEIGPTTRGTATAQKPHVCEVCGRPFRRRKDIRRHLSTHSNGKPFYCWACCLTFRSREYLRRHLRRVHGQWHPSDGGPSGLPRVEQCPAVQSCALKQNIVEQIGCRSKDVQRYKIRVTRERQGLPSLRHPTEEVVGNANARDRPGEQGELRGKDDQVVAEKGVARFSTSAQETVTFAVSNGILASSKPSEREPSAANASLPRKAPCALYLCDGCGKLMSHNNVMILSNKPAEQRVVPSVPRVLCKACFIQKTGIICIGW